jgi:hypothetical protein
MLYWSEGATGSATSTPMRRSSSPGCRRGAEVGVAASTRHAAGGLVVGARFFFDRAGAFGTCGVSALPAVTEPLDRR